MDLWKLAGAVTFIIVETEVPFRTNRTPNQRLEAVGDNDIYTPGGEACFKLALGSSTKAFRHIGATLGSYNSTRRCCLLAAGMDDSVWRGMTMDNRQNSMRSRFDVMQGRRNDSGNIDEPKK